MTQLAVNVEVLVGGASVAPAGTHSVSVVSEAPGGAPVGHGCQFPAVLPGVVPCAVTEHIANGIAGNGCAIVGGQQVAPGAVVEVIDLLLYCSEGAGGIGIFFPVLDVTCAVIGVGQVAFPEPAVAMPQAQIAASICNVYCSVSTNVYTVPSS